ncbi:MAG: PepSY domain-containing protein [Akkermansiaceae bacterium]
MTDSPSPPAPSTRRRRFARQWHRWLGLAAALPLLWLSATGLLLNHADRFGLHDAEVTTGWVLRHYNQVPEGDLRGIMVGDRLVSTWGGLIFLDHGELVLNGELVGAVAFKNQLVIATNERIAVVNGTGEMELELDDLSLPPLPIKALGSSSEGIILRTESGVHLLSEDFFSFKKTTLEPSAPPLQLIEGDVKTQLAEAIRERNSMPLSRVILDAHSGSLFGWPGWVITDLTAVGAIILTLLGLRLFPKRKS